MTAQRSGDGTAKYQPPVFGPSQDLFGLANPAQASPNAVGRAPAQFSLSKLDKDGNYYYCRVILSDNGGGLNAQRGLFPDMHDRAASSTLDTRYPGTAVLPPLLNSATTPDPASTTPSQLYYVNIFGTLAIGAPGSSAGDKVLFRETSATDPTIIDTTYDPDYAGGYSTSGHIWPAYLGSASASLQLVISRTDGANGAQVLSDLGSPPTEVGEMHVKTNNLTGLIQTALPDRPLLLCANGSSGAFNIYSKVASSAITADPGTATLTNLPFLEDLGLLSLGGGPVRAYWLASDGNKPYIKGVSVFDQGSFKVLSTNQQGTDPQFVGVPGIDVIFGGLSIWGGFVVWNSRQVVFFNGRTWKSLRPFSNRTLTSNVALAVWNIWKSEEDDLYMQVMQYRLNSSGANNTYWREKYDRDRDCFQSVSGQLVTTLTTPNAKHFGRLGSPYSYQTRNLYDYIDGSWHYQFQPELGLNSLGLAKSNGAAAASGIQFEATGTLTWPAMQIPGLEGWGLALRRISGNPQIDIGGGTPTTYPSVTVSVAGQSCTFVYGQTQGRQEFQFFDNENVVYEIQPTVTIIQQAGGTDPTRQNSQALPIVLELIARRPEFQMGSEIGDWTR